MILRILLLCAAVFASDNKKKEEEHAYKKAHANKDEPKDTTCFNIALCSGAVVGICAAFYFFYLYEEGLLEKYDHVPMTHPLVIPDNYKILWNRVVGTTSETQTCLMKLVTGFTVAKMAAVKNAGEKAWEEAKCVPSVLKKLEGCIYGNNEPLGFDKKLCSKDMAEDMRKDLELLYKAIDPKDWTLQANRCAEYPTGIKIGFGGLPKGLTFKSPSSSSLSGCLDPVQTPLFDTSTCGKHAVVQFLGTGGFWNPTGWIVGFPKAEEFLKAASCLADPKKGGTAECANKLDLEIVQDQSLNSFFENALRYFKHDSFRIKLKEPNCYGACPIATVRVQFINGATWYKNCKSSFWSDHTYPSPDWSSKCSLDSWFNSYSGQMPVAVSIEAKNPDGSTTYFRSHAEYHNGFFSNSKETQVYECTEDFKWSGAPSIEGCALVLTGSGTNDGSYPLLEVKKEDGTDPISLVAYHISDFYTNKMKNEYEGAFNVDARAYDDYEARKEAREAKRNRINKQ